MDICPPAIATAALFIAVILLDLYTRDWRRAPGRALFGIFATLLMIFICQRGSHTMAWILLAAPFVLVFLGWIFRAHSEVKESDDYTRAYENTMNPGCACPCCGSMPCHCMRPCPETRACRPKPEPKCKPKNKPCTEDSYFELWLTTK
jgi:hypothetical protein